MGLCEQQVGGDPVLPGLQLMQSPVDSSISLQSQAHKPDDIIIKHDLNLLAVMEVLILYLTLAFNAFC